MSSSVNTYQHITIAPFTITHLQTIKVVKTFNEHTRMSFTAIIPEELKDSYINQTGEHLNVSVQLTGPSGKPKPWFKGLVRNISVKAVRGIYYLYVDAVSYSYLLDRKRRERSFQNPSMTYSQLADLLISTYKGADVIDTASNNKAISTYVMQYEETDWQFLKRMASRFYTGLTVVSTFDSPKFYFGLPKDIRGGKIEAAHYTIKKRLDDYQTAASYAIPGIVDDHYIVYEVQSEQQVELGSEVTFKSQQLIVGKAVHEMKDGVLTNTYELFPRAGLKQKKTYNPAIIGASVQGKVLQINKDRIRAKLDMDDQQD